MKSILEYLQNNEGYNIFKAALGSLTGIGGMKGSSGTKGGKASDLLKPVKKPDPNLTNSSKNLTRKTGNQK